MIFPYPRCPQCDMFVSHEALNGRYTTMEFCRWGAERKWSCLEEEEARVGSETVITEYGTHLTPFTFFKYIGQILTEADDD